MKKSLLFLTVVVCVCVLTVALAGCGDECPGHEFTYGECDWENGVVTLVCGVCGATITEEADVDEIVTEPTCVEGGSKKYSATVNIGGNTYNYYEKEVGTGALGHKYSPIEYTWSANHATCTAKKVCSVCGHIVSEKVNSRLVVTKVETCSAEGEQQYEAVFENTEFVKQIAKEIIPKDPHNYEGQAIGYIWYNNVCIASRLCKDCGAKDSESVACELITVIAPNCTEDGVGKYVASFRNAAFDGQTTEIVLEAEGHSFENHYDWSEDHMICTAKEICSVCGAIGEEEESEAEVTRLDSTCTALGSDTFVATFENLAFEEQTAVVMLDKLPHEPNGEISYVWDDNHYCTATLVCSECEGTVIEKVLGAYSEVTRPTCVEDGEGKYVAVFENGLFTEQTKMVELEALGHRAVTFSFEWSADHTSCVAKETCGICQEEIEEIETQEITDSITTAKTCTADGERTYQATFVFTDGNVKTDYATEVIPMSHEYSDPVYLYTWENGTLKAIAAMICSDCGDIVKEEVEGVFTYVNEEDGKIYLTYVATFETDAFETQTIEIVIDK